MEQAKAPKLCLTCGGVLISQGVQRTELIPELKDGSTMKPIYRYHEHFRCHNGHLHMVEIQR